MNSKRIKPFLVPVIYGCFVIMFLCGMYFIQMFASKMMFSNDKDLEYVDGDITSDDNSDIPVVSTDVTIVRPYLDNTVKIGKTFYDYQGDEEGQEKSIIYYENTYMQNSGVDYTSENVFDIISILDGTVISVQNSDILGTSVEIRHSNNLISVYQGLSEVNVKENDQVVQGQIVAKSGTSNINKDLGNHLHFELYYNGKIVNPEEYYNKSINEL